MKEKDIEDYLFEHPEIMDYPVEYWLARQFKVPSGIIDLLGCSFDTYENKLLTDIWVVEVKNVPIKKQHLTQVYRYYRDIEFSLDGMDYETRPAVYKILITPYAPDDRQLLVEADAMDVRILWIDFNDAASTIEISAKWDDIHGNNGLTHSSIREGEIFKELQMLMKVNYALGGINGNKEIER